MNTLTVPHEIAPLLLNQAIASSQSATHVAQIGAATFTITESAQTISVGASQLIMSAEGIRLDAPRIDLNLDRD